MATSRARNLRARHSQEPLTVSDEITAQPRPESHPSSKHRAVQDEPRCQQKRQRLASSTESAINIAGRPRRRPVEAPRILKINIKEQISSNETNGNEEAVEDTNSEPLLQPARLTRENLSLFTKAMSGKGRKLSSGSRTRDDDTTKTSSTTSSGFALKALKNGILGPEDSEPPRNLDDIRNRLAKSRQSGSPTKSEYEDFVDNVKGATNEATMVFESGRALLKDYPREGRKKPYRRAFNQSFTAFPKNQGFNNGLSAPQPDFTEGLAVTEYLPYPVDENISGAVLVSDDRYSVTLPHVAGEWKGKGKDMTVAEVQSAYVGAALVFARNNALQVTGNPDEDGQAEVSTFTTDGTNLNIYAHYSQKDDKQDKYHQHPVESYNLVRSYEGFKEGRRALRNQQDHAKDLSYNLRESLVDHWNKDEASKSALRQEYESGQVKRANEYTFPVQEEEPVQLSAVAEDTNYYPGGDEEFIDQNGYEAVDQGSTHPASAPLVEGHDRLGKNAIQHGGKGEKSSHSHFSKGSRSPPNHETDSERTKEQRRSFRNGSRKK